jgi:hypothetical protein
MLLGNYVAEVDADAEPDTPLVGYLWLTVAHPALDLRGTSHGIHHAGKLGKEAIAGVLYDPAAMFPDLGLDQLPEVGPEPLMGAFLIRPRTHDVHEKPMP